MSMVPNYYFYTIPSTIGYSMAKTIKVDISSMAGPATRKGT